MIVPKTLPSPQTLLSAAGSAAAAAMLLRSVARDYLPQELRFFVLSKLRSLLSSLTFHLTLIVDEYDALSHNHLFQAASLYLRPNLSPSSTTNRFRATMPPKHHKISLSMDHNEEIVDTFLGVRFRWRFVSKPIASKYIQSPGQNQEPYALYKSEIRHFELRFHRKHKTLALDQYLPYVIEQSKKFGENAKTLKIFTLRSDRLRGRRGDPWNSVVLDHPATFETVAMEAEVKKTVVEDLERFVKRREMYRRIGKAWKRGYLLYGPPGTGKSSLIAAMANYLNFDVYDLEITDVRKNSDLRKVLMATANRSILVVEDIDCSLELRDRDVRSFSPYQLTSGSEVTLSGFLNFIDGLWSSCGDERIIVFTTNHKEKLDPALLRPGRMDVHIHMSYCTPSGFKVLASNYLGVTHHSLFSVIEEFIATMKVTPAEIGEYLMKSDEPEIALRGLIEFLEGKRRVDEVTRVKEAKHELEDEKKGDEDGEEIQNIL